MNPSERFDRIRSDLAALERELSARPEPEPEPVPIINKEAKS